MVKGVAILAKPEEISLMAYLTAVQEYAKVHTTSTSRTTKGLVPEDDAEGTKNHGSSEEEHV